MATTAAIVQMRTDDEIRNDVVHELRWDPKLGSKDIAVDVKDGVVTLSGFVSSFWQRRAAEKTVKRLRGCEALRMTLELSSSGSEQTRRSHAMRFTNWTNTRAYRARTSPQP
jgi:osmotically-inducible protein OsmY